MDGGGRIPHLLRQAFYIDRFGSPYGGGWMSWPAGYINKLSACLSVYEVYRSKNAGAGDFANWANKHPKEFEMFATIERMRRDQL